MLCSQQANKRYTRLRKRLNGIYLNESRPKKVVEVFDEKLQSTLDYKKIKRNVSYKTLIRLELYKLEKHFMGEDIYRPFVAECDQLICM